MRLSLATLGALCLLLPARVRAQACEEGRELTEGGRCCWPGQAWSDEDAVCEGAPRCPGRLVREADRCVRPARVGAANPSLHGPGRVRLGRPQLGEVYARGDGLRGTSFARYPDQPDDDDDGPGFDEGLVIAGSIVLGLGYVAAALTGALTAQGLPAIPVLGAYLWPITNVGLGLVVGLPLGVVQTAGFAILLVGLVSGDGSPDEDEDSYGLAPRLAPGPGEVGLGLAWDL